MDVFPPYFESVLHVIVFLGVDSTYTQPLPHRLFIKYVYLGGPHRQLHVVVSRRSMHERCLIDGQRTYQSHARELECGR